MKALRSILRAAAVGAAATEAGNLPPVQTAFVSLLENHNWADFAGDPDAPFMNGTRLPLGSHWEQYYNPPGLHPREVLPPAVCAS